MFAISKRFILITAFCLLSSPGWAATAHVKGDSNRLSDAGHVIQNWSVTGGMTNSGDTVAGAVFWRTTASNLTSVTVCGNTATLLDTYTGSTTIRGYSFVYANVSSGACTISANWDANVGDSFIVMHEVSGVDTANPTGASHVGQTQFNPGTGADALTSTAITPPENGRYIFGVTGNAGNACIATAGTGFTGVVSTNTRVSEYVVQGTAASIAATFTGCNDRWITFVIALKDASAGGGGGGSTSGMLLRGVQ